MPSLLPAFVAGSATTLAVAELTAAPRATMRRRRIACSIGFLLAVVLLGAVPASAGWDSGASGIAHARALSLQPPAAPTATRSGQNVTVSWTALAIGGSTASAYVVHRYDSLDVEHAVLAGCEGDRTGTSCVEASVPGGTWRYRVSAKKGAWTGPLSAASSDLVVPLRLVPDPPTGVTLNGGGAGNNHVNNANKSTVTVSVALPTSSVSTDTVMVEITRSPGTPAATATAQVQAGVDGVATVTTGAVNTISPNVLTDGTLTVRAKIRPAGGAGATDSAFVSAAGTQTKDTIAPANALTLTGVGLSSLGFPQAYLTATSIRYKGNATASRSFQIVNTVTDTGSGPGSSTFATLTGTTTGWSFGGSTVSAPSGGPFVSGSFTWANPTTSAPVESVTGADVAGNTAVTSRTFANDITIPTGTVTAPVAAANLTGTVNVTSTAADASSGVRQVQFQRSPAGAYSWTSVGAPDTTSPYAVSWDTAALTDGLYDLRALITDNVSNQRTSATIAGVRVDNTAPTGAVTEPSASASVGGASVAISSNSADLGSGVASATFSTSPAGAGTWTPVGAADTVAPYSVSWNTTGLADGSYDLRAVTIDRVGKSFTSPVVTVTVGNADPPTTVTLNGGGVGNAYVNSLNESSVTVSVLLPASSRATDVVMVEITRAAGTPAETAAAQVTAGVAGVSTATTGPIDTLYPHDLSEGALTVSAKVRPAGGAGAGDSASVAAVGPHTKDTVVPSAPTASAARSNGAGAVGQIRQGTGYHLYANAADTGSGIQSVSADDSAFNAEAPSVLAAGSYSVDGTGYAFRSGVLTANTPLTTGATLAYALTATDLAGNLTTANPTVTIETYASVVLATSGLIGHWRLGETSGTTASDEKAANPGSYWPGSGYTLGQADPLAGDTNGAVDLDGVTGFAYVPDSAAVKPAAAVSIEAWVNPDSLTGTRWIVVKDTFYYLYIANGSVIFGVSTTTLGYQYVTTTAVTTGSWQHLVGTYDGAAVNLYRNGINVATGPASGPIAASTGALYFGVYGPPASGFYDGDLDEIALYGSGLSAATVSDHYESGRGS